MNAIEIKNLSKNYEGYRLDNLNLTLPGGCIMGLIGENGAGKSTTIKLILDILHKDSGSVTVLGRDNEKLTKEDVGVVMDEAGIPECLTPEQVGKVMANIFKNWDAAEYERLIKEFDLPVNKAYKDFSRGMKMKLGIAVAMSHNAKLLLLDEHTAALDPGTAEKVLDLTEKIVEENDLCCLMITHNMQSALELGNRTLMMDAGKIIYDVSGEERKNVTVPDLLAKFREASGKNLDNDRMLLN